MARVRIGKLGLPRGEGTLPPLVAVGVISLAAVSGDPIPISNERCFNGGVGGSFLRSAL